MAFVILALSLTLLLRVFGAGMNTVQTATDYQIAVQLAESLMAKTGIETPLPKEAQTGVFADRYHWQVTSQPWQFDASNTANARLVKLIVNVEWQHRHIQLVSIKLVNR